MSERLEERCSVVVAYATVGLDIVNPHGEVVAGLVAYGVFLYSERTLLGFRGYLLYGEDGHGTQLTVQCRHILIIRICAVGILY